MEFKTFKQKFQENFKQLISNQTPLYLTNINKDTLWNTYLSSFPVEVKQEYNCNCCIQFIKNYGNVVTIKNNKVVSAWEFDTLNLINQKVADNLNKLVISAPIKEVFITKQAKLGTDYNFATPTLKWEHFFYQLPKELVTKSSDSKEAVQAKFRDAKNVFKRSLDELTIDSVEIVLELINQNSLYRGTEFTGVLEAFLKCAKEYKVLSTEQKDNYCWVNSISQSGTISKIRNTSIGTLLIDISEGVELDVAVSKFERIMAPTNYKRPTAIISKKMVEEAEKTITELGLVDSLARRFATADDITVNNVLFVNRDSKKTTGIFNELKEDITINPKKLSKVEEISITDFIEKIIPKANSIEFLLENRHQGNLVSLIAPVNPESPSLFKWGNRFSWSYENALADSMKERVKATGGKVDGVLRFSIQWNDKGDNNIDFDAHCKTRKEHINFRTYRKPSIAPSTGQLDVDIIECGNRVAVENITWSDLNKMEEGRYTFFVNNYSARTSNGGFSAEIEYDGEIYSFEYPKNLRGNENIIVAEIEFNKTKGVTFINSLDSTSTISSKELWGLNSNKFHKVNMILNSPNYWENNIGNKHIFFMLEGAKNTSNVRGFFNEFLKEELLSQKRVFEALAGKMKVEPADKQLSGLGFSTTTKGEFICRVEGNFSRMLKIVI